MVERRVILKTDPDTLLKPSSVAKKTGVSKVISFMSFENFKIDFI